MQGTSIMAVWPQSILRTLPFECFPAFTVLVLCHMIQGGVYNNSATVSNTASYTMKQLQNLSMFRGRNP